jgi:CRISPR-associated endonuclease/helicase Cas3
MTAYAHSVPGRPEANWEQLGDHLHAVAGRAEEFASAFGWGGAAGAAGLLHDIGKTSAQFQSYIRLVQAAAGVEHIRGGDHSTAGARVAVERYGTLGRLLAFGIAGHHAGLADGGDLDRRLDAKRTALPPFQGWERHVGTLPGQGDLSNKGWRRLEAHKGYSQAFLARMLFSCLVDADFLETERFYAAADGTAVPRGGHASVTDLLDRLRAYQAGRWADPTPLNRLRAEVLSHAVGKAELPPGLFTLTVPTGGGKTLTSLRFALEHAVRHADTHGMRRVVYVIPYTSIIEQTATVFRTVLGSAGDVLEHHASFDWEAAGRKLTDDGAGRDGLAALRRAAENWDAPVVVTTAVQFFESLHAARTSRCRKLHNLAGSVIVLDEAQTMPLGLLQPCLAVLDELCLNYRASAVLCTATQPAVRCQDGFKGGLDIPAVRELAPDPPGLYARLRRVRVERMPGLVDDAALADRFAACGQMLCIVNKRAHAAGLFGRIREMDGAAHLTTLMCPAHRRAVLARVRQRLADGLPVRLVSTSLIEAGVDISFPEVWRAMAGLDSVAQAAGRCNREGKMEGLGRTVVFEPAEHKPPRDVALLAEVAAGVLDRLEEPLALAAVQDYFRQLYWTRGAAAFDKATLDGAPFLILREIAEASPGFGYPFEKIARAFRMIDDAMDAVIVPWRGEDGADMSAEDLLRRIATMPRPLTDDLRRLQQYTIPVPPKARAYWLGIGALRAVHPALGDALLMFGDDSHYDAKTGVRLDDPAHRSAESNFF